MSAHLSVGLAGAQTMPGTLPPDTRSPAAPLPPVVLRPPAGGAPAAPTTPVVPVQAAAVQRFRGTLTQFDGPFLTLKTTDKKTVTLGMTIATRVVRNRMLQLGDLQPGWFIGVATLKSADGKTLRAQAIRVYPAEARGAGEGAYPIDPKRPDRLLIDGTVTAVAPGGIGGLLTVTFHGAAVAPGGGACLGKAEPDGCTGAAQIQFARGVPIVAIDAGDLSLLLPGATVAVTAAPDATGTPIATAVTVERDAPAPKAAKVP